MTSSKRLNVKETGLEFEKIARRKGFSRVESYLNHLHSRFAHLVPVAGVQASVKGPLKRVFKTQAGSAYVGNSLVWLQKENNARSVDLIMTSPPFGLIRKKSYGNARSEDYLNWFRPFAYGCKEVLKDNGSLVIDVGGSWNSGSPSRSLYHFDLLAMLVREVGFFLCQEFYWWNPSKLPTPAEWVNVRRVRVKDAVNTVWWLSKTPFPKASNTRILNPYSEAMKQVFKRGYHKPASRPSGHELTDKFIWDNGGGIPPNLIALANTQGRQTYFQYCRSKGLPVHPARFPVGLPIFFVKFLTNKGDLVLDPFAGSLTTGYASQRLGRRWINIDKEIDYVSGGRVRFTRRELDAPDEEVAEYRIFGPNVTTPLRERRLPTWGGKSRG